MNSDVVTFFLKRIGFPPYWQLRRESRNQYRFRGEMHDPIGFAAMSIQLNEMHNIIFCEGYYRERKYISKDLKNELLATHLLLTWSIETSGCFCFCQLHTQYLHLPV
jgi:hypothetical protein